MSKLEWSITKTCANCGTTNEYVLKLDGSPVQRKIVRCYPEVGGCDQLFVLEVSVEINSKLMEVKSDAAES